MKGPQSDIIQINENDETSVRYTNKINGSEGASTRYIIQIKEVKGLTQGLMEVKGPHSCT